MGNLGQECFRKPYSSSHGECETHLVLGGLQAGIQHQFGGEVVGVEAHLILVRDDYFPLGLSRASWRVRSVTSSVQSRHLRCRPVRGFHDRPAQDEVALSYIRLNSHRASGIVPTGADRLREKKK